MHALTQNYLAESDDTGSNGINDSEMHMDTGLNSVEELIEDIAAGRMVLIMDDEDRENEGDLVMAAEKVRPQDINFMAMHARGLICLTLTEERCKQLRLPLMVMDNNAHHGTKFTVSIEAAHGVTTGISAADRAATVLAAVNKNAKPSDLVQPGHIFPLMAREGGVLTRAGHTEVGCDLTALAGLEPAAVIVEVLNDDGTMARRPQLEAFAHRHGIKIGTVADVIHYRLGTEKTVERMSEAPLQTEFGLFRLYSYQDLLTKEVHFALAKGNIDPEKPTLVRVHVHDPICDLFGCRRGDSGWAWPLREMIRRMSDSDAAVAVILRQPETSSDLIDRAISYRNRGEPSGEPSNDLRTVGIGSQILHDLGVRRMRVLGSPKRVHALKGFDLEVLEYVSPY